MPKISKSKLFELLIFALIAQTFAAVLPPAQVWRRLTRQAIDGAAANMNSTTNDHDIAAVPAAVASDQSSAGISDEQSTLQLKSIEGVVANASTAEAGGESEIVHAGNNHESAVEHNSSAKLMLNRVESHEAESVSANDSENIAEKIEEDAEEKRETQDDPSNVNRDSDEIANTQLNANKFSEPEMEISAKGVESVFSTTNETLEKSLAPDTLKTHVNNGLDEVTQQLHGVQSKSVDSSVFREKQPATTETILKDVENVALKSNIASTTHTLASDDRNEDVTSQLVSEAGGTHTKENLEGLSASMGRSMDTVHSSENKLEAAFGEKTRTEEIFAKEISTTTTMRTILGAKSNIAPEKREKAETVATTTVLDEQEVSQNETKITKQQQKEAEEYSKSAINANSVTKTIKELAHSQTEIERNSHSNNTTAAEKRGKFINGSTMNSRNMNLPDGPEVWSLAGMRMVPKVMHNNGTSPLVDDDSSNLYSRWQLNEIVTTERTLNVSSHSEKNLLDWTKVMGMRGELEPVDTMEKNHLTDGLYENDGTVSVTMSKTEQPSGTVEKWHTERPSQINDDSKPHQNTKVNASTNVSEKPNATHVMYETEIMQNIPTTTTIATPTIATTTQPLFSSDFPLSVDKNDKHADFISTAVTVSVGETLNKSSSTSTESSTFQESAAKIDVGNFSGAIERSTQRQPNDDFNFIVTSTTPLAVLETVFAATTTATMPTAFPLEQSTSTTPSLSGAAAPNRWENTTALEAKPETTPKTLPSNVDAGVNHTKADVDVANSSNDGVHDVTIEQHSKREPETVTETETEAPTTLLTVSELPSSEAHETISAGERESSANVNASKSANLETGAGHATQNETLNVAKETTTENSYIATTTAVAFINTTLLSTDLVDPNVSAQTSEVPTATVTERATTTEVGQIGNEVELEVRTVHITAAADEQTETETTTLNSDTGSSADKVLLETTTVTASARADNEANTTAKTVSSINELLMPVTNTTTSTTTVPITTPPTHLAVKPVLYATTTLKSVESVNEDITTTINPLEGIAVRPTGSVFDNSTTTTAPTPVAIKNHTAVAEGTHDIENSIETNAIDQLDKTTVKISDINAITATSSTTTTIAATTTTTTTEVTIDEGIGEADATQVEKDSGVSNATTLSVKQSANTNRTTIQTTTMSTNALNTDGTSVPLAPEVNNTSHVTSTAEPPLINLLDDSTTPRIMTPISIPNLASTTTSSIGIKPEEVYTVLSTTESTTTSVSTSTIAIAPLVPVLPTTTTIAPPVDSSTAAYFPTVASTIAIITTTMLPPTLHAAIGGATGGGSSSTGVGGGRLPTHLPDMINAGMRPNSSEANETDVNVIIAITVSVIGVVALILLVAFLYLMRKRQKQMSYGQRCRPVSLDAYSLDNVSVLGSVRRKGALRASKRSYGNIAFDDPSLRRNALSASELAKFVERRSSIFEEFRDVPQITARADEVPTGCEDKNRYANVIPLPETRVVLQELGDDDKTEYINANYVRGPKDAPNYYIATQAPLEITVADFWRMIWEQQSRVIIQATDLYENGIEKCAEYLPPSVTLDNHTTYGDFQITLRHREVKDKYAISTLLLKNTAANMSRELTHYWYKWPETGVPSEEAPIIAMLLEARSSLKGYANETREKSSNATLKTDSGAEVTTNGNGVTVIAMEDPAQRTELERVNGMARENGSSGGEINGNVSTTADVGKGTTLRNQGPLTIHCSPGTGRTGTIIACDMAIRSLETPKRSVDIPQIVYYVRRGRASAVQTKEQYEFIYKVAHMYATKITNLSNDN